MANRRYCYRDVLPLATLMILECFTVAMNTLFKTASNRGLVSYPVFIAYAHGVSALLLLPSPFFSPRSSVLPPLNFSIMSKICLLGLIGYGSQQMGFAGLSYSSPTLSSTISNLVPAFTFILAIIFRMEKLALRSSSTQAKILGTIVSITGAFVVVLYKGPPLLFASLPPNLLHDQPLGSPHSEWIIGGLFLTTHFVLLAFWYILLVSIMKEYTAEFTVMFFYNLCISVVAATVGLITEPNSSAWRLKLDIALLYIVCSGVFSYLLTNIVHAWALHLKGALYVAMFRPLSIVIAMAMGVMFLGDTIYVGRVVGATIISVGFYTVMWGKAKEEIIDDCEIDNLESSLAHKSPLLKSYKTQGV